MIAYGRDKNLEEFGVFFNPTIKPGNKFIKRVEKDLPLDSNNISIALKLYNNLNEIVEYSEEVQAFNQDLAIDFLKRIYDTPINMINFGNNEVTCKNWSELYCYFLMKHNIPCVINGVVHKKVYFREAGFLFCADGSSKIKDDRDNSSMNDLTRSKLGLRPCGLTALVVDENGAKSINVYDLGLPLASETSYEYESFNDRTKVIIDKLLNNTDFKVQQIPTQDNPILSNFSLINDLLLEENLSNVSTIAYTNNLIKILFSKQEQKNISFKCIKEKSGNKYKHAELINYGNEREHKRDYSNTEGHNFICGGLDAGLKEITKRKARKMIEESAQLELELSIEEGRRLK